MNEEPEDDTGDVSLAVYDYVLTEWLSEEDCLAYDGLPDAPTET